MHYSCYSICSLKTSESILKIRQKKNILKCLFQIQFFRLEINCEGMSMLLPDITSYYREGVPIASVIAFYSGFQNFKGAINKIELPPKLDSNLITFNWSLCLNNGAYVTRCLWRLESLDIYLFRHIPGLSINELYCWVWLLHDMESIKWRSHCVGISIQLCFEVVQNEGVFIGYGGKKYSDVGI